MASGDVEDIRTLLRSGVTVTAIVELMSCERAKVTRIKWYLDNPDYVKNWRKQRPGYNTRKMREYRQNDHNGTYRAAIARDLKKKRERYHSDPEYREKVKAWSTAWHRRKRQDAGTVSEIEDEDAE